MTQPTEPFSLRPGGYPIPPGKAGQQSEPSVAWTWGNPGREAYTGSEQAVGLSSGINKIAGADAVHVAESCTIAPHGLVRSPRRSRRPGHAHTRVAQEPGRSCRLLRMR